MLRLLVERPDLLSSVNTTMVDLGLSPLTGDDLDAPEERAVFEFMAEHIARYNGLDMESIDEGVAPVIRQVLDGVLQLAEGTVFPSEEQAAGDAVACALRLREQSLQRRVEKLRFLQEDAAAQNGAELMLSWKELVDAASLQLDTVHRALGERGALKALRNQQVRVVGST